MNEDGSQDYNGEISKKKRKEDKIFRSSYFHGDKMKGEEYEMKKRISIEQVYSEAYMSDTYDLESNIDTRKMADAVMDYIEENEELRRQLIDKECKKFTKTIVNSIFKQIYERFVNDKEYCMFVSPVQIFDTISNLSGLKYKNMFDLMEFENRQIIIKELHDKYGILDTYAKFGGNMH